MSSKKGIYRSRLADVPVEKEFRCHGGGNFRNLEQLAYVLQGMSEESFNHHVTEQNNDFSNWIQDVVGDSALAKNLRTVRNRNKARRIVEERIAWLRARI